MSSALTMAFLNGTGTVNCRWDSSSQLLDQVANIGSCWVGSLNLSRWFFVFWICIKLWLLEKMIIDYKNGLHILSRSKKISFLQQIFFQHGLKTWNSGKTETRPLSYQKTIPKRILGLIYLHGPINAHKTVVYVTAYLAIMLSSLLANCRG